MFCFNYNHSNVKNYENDKYSNFKQLASLLTCKGPSPRSAWTGRHIRSLWRVQAKEASFVFASIFTEQEVVSWLIVGQSPQTKYSLFVYKKLVSDHQRQAGGCWRERRKERERE